MGVGVGVQSWDLVGYHRNQEAGKEESLNKNRDQRGQEEGQTPGLLGIWGVCQSLQ